MKVQCLFDLLIGRPKAFPSAEVLISLSSNFSNIELPVCIRTSAALVDRWPCGA
jgi:hypothetical protein